MAAELLTSLEIAWGIPVDILDLTVNLQAYLDSKEALMTFRLCAQHPKAYVSKLPPELVAMIEDFVIQHARSRMRASLFQSYQCFKAECKLRDHASELGADDVKRYERIYEECCTDGDFCSDHRDEMLENGCFCKDVREAHVEYTDMWSCEIASHWNMEPYSEHNSSPRPLAKGLLKNFGLQAILSDHSLNKEEIALAGHGGWALSVLPPMITSCLLTLPCAVANEEIDKIYTDSGSGDYGENLTSASFLIDPASLSLRKKDRALFKHAMRVLGLQPFIHLYQMRHRLSARLKKPIHINRIDSEGTTSDPDDRSVRGDRELLKARKFMLEHAQWPQLMNIVSSRMKTYV